MSDLESRQPALFRRRRFEAPHRRRHPLRRLARPFAGALAVVGIPAALAWWVLTSPQFEIGRIEVVAGGRVSQAWLEDQLRALHGRHLLAVRLAEIEDRVVDHPWVAELEVRRRLPGRLEITVVEERPAALWIDGGELFLLDAWGRRIDRVDPAAGPLDLTLLSAPWVQGDATAIAARAIELAARWESLRPEDPVSQIEILRSGDYRLVTSSLPFTVVIRPERLEFASAALERALEWIEQRPIRISRVGAVDLRFSRQIVFQPAAAPPGEEG